LELDPEIIKLLLKLLAKSPWFLLAVLLVWPEKGVIPLWIKSRRDTKFAEIKRDTIKAEVQERALKRLEQQQPLKLPPANGDSDDNIHR
jgi:hypothetical protein